MSGYQTYHDLSQHSLSHRPNAKNLGTLAEAIEARLEYIEALVVLIRSDRASRLGDT